MASKVHFTAVTALCLMVCAVLAPPVAAQDTGDQQTDGADPFEGFELNGEDTGDDASGDSGLTLSDDTGLIPNSGDSDIQLNLGGQAQGTFESFPGVTGPVTSIAQPATMQGATVQLRALDKMLGQPTDIELSMGQTVVFGRIAIRVIECRYPAATPESDAFALLHVLDLDGDVLFDGWMIASSPALNALEHSRYDVWVLGCDA